MAGPVVDLTALPPVVIVRGIANWLGVPTPAEDIDESYEAYLERLSEAAS
jgi:hypothetical protein